MMTVCRRAEVGVNTPMTRAEFRKRILQAHPDKGGGAQGFLDLVRERDERNNMVLHA